MLFRSTSGSATSAATCAGWNSGTGLKYWQVDFSTQGYFYLTVSSAQRSSNTGPRDWKIQYRIGTGGTWTDVPSAAITVANNWTTGVVNNISLPDACSNQSQVFLRWIMTSGFRADGVNGVASAGTSAIDNIVVNGNAASFVTGYNSLSVAGASQSVKIGRAHV